MGSFRSKASIDSALGTLVPRAEVDALLTDPQDAYPHPQASDVLEAGEWVKYRLVMPLPAANAVADAAARPLFDDKGQFKEFAMQTGYSTQVKLEQGIVGGKLLDEGDQPVMFDSRKPTEFVVGMNELLRRELLQIIGEDDEPDLAEPDPDDPSVTVGKDSGGTSASI